MESDTDFRKEKAVEEFLSYAIDSIAANIWECDFLVRFLDVAQDQSIMSKIRIDVMSKKVQIFTIIIIIGKTENLFLFSVIKDSRIGAEGQYFPA